MVYEITLKSERIDMIRHAMKCAVESARINAVEAFNDPARPVDEVDKLSKEYMTLREAFDWWEQFTIDVYHGDS